MSKKEILKTTSRATVENAYHGVKDITISASKFIGGVLGMAKGAFTLDGKEFREGGKNIFKGLGDWFKSFANPIARALSANKPDIYNNFKNTRKTPSAAT